MSGTRDMSGSISKNDKKEKESHPDIKGRATIGGVDYWISGWQKENERGKWYSLSFTPKDAANDQPAPRASKPAADDDLPF